ncbi:hypothetical protein ES703_15119 [subsurface metagenome]
MKLEKAIERQQRLLVDLKYWKDDERDKAIQLGIEALEHVTELRHVGVLSAKDKLPSETKE